MTGAVVTLGALAVFVARTFWPNLGIDAVAVTLLALAALPWLGNIFKSFNTPFGGAEYREFRDRLQQAEGRAGEALLIAETSEARDLARHDARTRRDSASIVDLAKEYDVTRANLKPGRSRTDEMTRIVGRMVAAYEAGEDIDIRSFMTDAMGGRRLAAYVRLYVKPEGTHALSVVEALTKEAQNFCAYWALRSLSRMVETEPEALDRNTIRRLEEFAEGLPPHSDRRYQIGRILARV